MVGIRITDMSSKQQTGRWSIWDRHRQMTRWQGSRVTRYSSVTTPRLDECGSTHANAVWCDGTTPTTGSLLELVSRIEVADTIGFEAVESERIGLGELE